MSERIEINPQVCGGQPVVKGTRIPVATILEQLADDESWDSLFRGYPELTREDVQAALQYAPRNIQGSTRALACRGRRPRRPHP